ncbi:MAG: hypothetical protein DRN08_05205 [Thermoplasmata archaeon]|nr:MAG: hypothetical protein DRN08_05205 [Thermoplasmata archaeon]
MAKKFRIMRTFARTASKSQEKSLVENAKKLRENPFLILPECIDEKCRKHFRGIKKRLEKINRFKDDMKKLEKLSKKKGLEGALAGTLLLALSGKAPYLGVMRFPTGDITYAQRGKADKEKLIAMQHLDNPIMRLLGIKDIAIKKELHVYSWDKGFICTGQKPNPPPGFITFILNKIGVPYKKNVAACRHIEIENAKKKKFLEKNYLRIHWRSANTTIAICEDCAKNTKNTIFTISMYLLAPNLSDDFNIEVITQITKHRKRQESSQKENRYLKDYLTGKLTDYEFIQKKVAYEKETLKESSRKLLILDGISYGSDIKKFLDALKPKKFERAGLQFILERIEKPLIVSNTTPNKILEMYWKQYGTEIIDTIIQDRNMAKSLAQLDETPSNILKTAFEYKKRKQILSQLPHYQSLPPLAEYADHIAKTYKALGEKKAIGEIKKRPNDTKGKSLAYAFLLALEKNEDTKWQYTPIEIEYGEYLKKYAKNLLDSQPKNYHKALQELLRATGSTEIIKPSDP